MHLRKLLHSMCNNRHLSKLILIGMFGRIAESIGNLRSMLQ